MIDTLEPVQRIGSIGVKGVNVLTQLVLWMEYYNILNISNDAYFDNTHVCFKKYL